MRAAALLLVLLAACSGEPTPKVATTPAVPCASALGHAFFREPGTTHVLVADFDGAPVGGASAAALADRLVTRIAAERARAEAADVGGHVPVQALEVARISCAVVSHAMAREVARRSDADLIVWGRTGCSLSAPAEVCAGVTLRGDAHETRLSAFLPRFDDVFEFDLPPLRAADAPFAGDFVVGLHLYQQDDMPRAAWAFAEAARTMGFEGPNTAIVHLFLGRALRKVPALEAALRSTTTAFERVRGSGTALESAVLSDLAWTRSELGEHAEAERLVTQAVAIDEKRAGTADPLYAMHLSQLGRVRDDRDDYRGAVETEERALSLAEAALGKDHYALAVRWANLGRARRDAGDNPGAMEAFRHGLSIAEDALGPDHPSLAVRSGWAPDGPRSGLVVVRCGGEACRELQSGDWIVTVGGTPVRDASHLTELAQRVPPGKMASVGVVRAAKKVTLKVAGPELFVTEVLR